MAEAETVRRELKEPPDALPARLRITEYLVRHNGRGEMVTTLGPCWCGAKKNEWHRVH